MTRAIGFGSMAATLSPDRADARFPQVVHALAGGNNSREYATSVGRALRDRQEARVLLAGRVLHELLDAAPELLLVVGAPPDDAVQEDHERVAVIANLVVVIRLEQAVGQTRLVVGEGELIEQLVHVRILGVGQRAEE